MNSAARSAVGGVFVGYRQGGALYLAGGASYHRRPVFPFLWVAFAVSDSVSLELISFKLCPFVQRSVIALKYQQMDFELTFIDLENPPEWFAEVSPLEQVPVLRVDGEHNLFESAVILEYIDDISEHKLSPADPLLRAKNRAWTELASLGFGALFEMTGAADEKAFKRAKVGLLDKLELLEEQVVGPFFNGDEPALIDFAIAPLLMRLALVAERVPVLDAQETPKMVALSEALLAMDAVADSVVPEFAQMYRGMMSKRSAYLASLA